MTAQKFLIGLLSSTALLGAGAAVDSANASFFTLGDVMASTGGGTVRDYTPDLTTLQHTLNTTLGGLTTGSAFDGSGNFYVTNFSVNSVTKFDNTGAVVSPAAFFTGGSQNEFDRNRQQRLLYGECHEHRRSRDNQSVYRPGCAIPRI